MGFPVRALKAGLAYFALVFGAGFLFGVVRVPLLVPRLGVRTAELLEMPLMGLVVLGSARFIVRRFDLPASARVRLGAGLVALALMVGAEVTLAVLLQGRSIADLVADRDPVSGTVYLAMLALFACMPLLLAWARAPRVT